MSFSDLVNIMSIRENLKIKTATLILIAGVGSILCAEADDLITLPLGMELFKRLKICILNHFSEYQEGDESYRGSLDEILSLLTSMLCLYFTFRYLHCRGRLWLPVIFITFLAGLMSKENTISWA